MTYPIYAPRSEHCITEDERYDEDSNLWGQFVDIESMSLFQRRTQRKCKSKKNNYAPCLDAITESPEDQEKCEAWYNEANRSSICFHAEMLGKFVWSLLYGFTYVENSTLSTSIAKSPPV